MTRDTSPFDFSVRPADYGEPGSSGPACPAAFPGSPTVSPRLRENETEIARITFPKSVHGDVISIRARPISRGWAYRAWDESVGVELPICRKTSRRTLTFGQLVELVESVEDGLIRRSWEFYHDPNGYPPERCVAQIAVHSHPYPQLEAWYEREAATWCREQGAAQVARDEADDAPPHDETKDVAPHLRRLAFAAADLARELGYDGEDLFTPEGARAYQAHAAQERAAACFGAFTGRRTSAPHYGPLHPEAFDADQQVPDYEDPWHHRNRLFLDLPGIVLAVAEASRAVDGLPPRAEGEVEIARVTLGEAENALSLRARPVQAGHALRLVDALGRRLRLPVDGTLQPLRLGEVFKLLECAWEAGPDGSAPPAAAPGLVQQAWDHRLRQGEAPHEAQEGVTVTSVYYPGLHRAYRHAFGVFRRRRAAEAGKRRQG